MASPLDSLKPSSLNTPPRHSPTTSFVERASTEPRTPNPRSSSPSTPQSLVFSLSPLPRPPTPSSQLDNIPSGEAKSQSFAWPTDATGSRLSPVPGHEKFEKRPQRARAGSLIPDEHEHGRGRHMSTSSQFFQTTINAPDLSLSMNSPRDRPAHLTTDSPTRFNLQVCLSPSIFSLAQCTTPGPVAPSSPSCSAGASEAPFFPARSTSMHHCSPHHTRQHDKSGMHFCLQCHIRNPLLLWYFSLAYLTFYGISLR